MSFRKRSEVIAGRSPVAVPGRGSPIGAPAATRGIGASVRSPASTLSRTEVVPEVKNQAVRPSLITSQPTVSTGVADLDKILLHQGLPLGQSLLIEESGTTDFASVILRCCTSQGVLHSRIEGSAGTHIIVLGVPSQWATELPGLYKGSSRDQKKAKILENESKVSVSNMAQAAGANRDMKIAWRYGLNKQPQQETNQAVEEDDFYNNQFDITQKLVPAPNPHEISFVTISSNFAQLIQQITSNIEHQLKSAPSRIIRLVIPNLLNPSVYPPACSAFTYIIPLVHGLRALTRKFSDNLILISSVPLDLYPRNGTLMASLECLFDSVIHLQPFNQEMSQLIEKAHKNEREKIQHGLVNILKSPVLSERGLMMVRVGEYAFKNGRKKFEIEEWGIPVEDDANDEQQTKVSVAF